MRLAASIAATLAISAAAGCGGGDHPGKPSAGGGQQTAPRTSTQPSRDAAPADTAARPGRTTPNATTSPEQQPGGAGDEVPARSQALLTGRGGGISPRLVQVPPFISIRVELRSADGARYQIRIGHRSLSVRGSVRSRGMTLDGLRPGRSYTGQGGGGPIRIAASAEPGP